MKASSCSSLLDRFDRSGWRSSAIFACVQGVALALIPERCGVDVAGVVVGLLCERNQNGSRSAAMSHNETFKETGSCR